MDSPPAKKTRVLHVINLLEEAIEDANVLEELNYELVRLLDSLDRILRSHAAAKEGPS